MTLSPLAAHAGETVPYTVDGEAFEGYRAKPAGTSKGLVVVIHTWGGLTSYEEKRADMIAALGYEAFAIDLYGKGNRPVDTDSRRKEAEKLYNDRARMRKLLMAGLAEARREGDQPAVVVGYCFGGAAALELARSGDANGIKGYVTFHGVLKTPGGESYSAGTPPLLILHGGADTSVTMDDVAALSRELEAAKVPYEIQVYAGAPHGFTVWDTERYRKDADEKSWAAFTRFLGTQLRG
ncbi:dienelactone hydrolase family protein [Methyloceanibacter sp.]|uniref:dienelactone hydrolase family protein n=1 Tax=Methyloceanibacter sp. TaxID=1965321 RepID=UPI002D541E5E|nr:dienelactone hydrolase family protein [Methyloceanibacter sp.]HZP09649.1 dienelactone hydrolase family protein [Methyloceanibacter sp.]